MSTQRWRGAFRPASDRFGRIAFFLLLAVPPAFSQQAKPLPAPASKLKPANEVVSETNDRIKKLASASNVKQGDYLIGSGDLLAIEVFDVPELSRDVRVNETGFISLPLLPAKVHAAGFTTFQLQDKLAELLQTSGLVSTPEVSVAVKEQHGEPITVIGEVKTPMVIQAVRQTTLLEALSQAGGITETAGNAVLVTRPAQPSSPAGDSAETSAPTSGQTFTINLADVLESGDPRFNIPLIGGDIVSVPRAGVIYIVGAVGRPGGYVLQSDRDRITTLKLLSLAGGTTSTAKATRSFILRKNLETGKRDELLVDLNRIMHLKAEDMPLESNDILVVPDSTGKKALRRTGDIATSFTTGLALLAASRF